MNQQAQAMTDHEAYEAQLKFIADGGTLSPEWQTWHNRFTVGLWEESKAALETAKSNEMALRKRVVFAISDPNKIKGTEHVALDDGRNAKIVKKINYGFIKDAEQKHTDIARVFGALEKIKTYPGLDGANLIANELVKWSPELSLTRYNILPPFIKEIIDDVIVTSDGAPTLEINEPKAK